MKNLQIIIKDANENYIGRESVQILYAKIKRICELFSSIEEEKLVNLSMS